MRFFFQPAVAKRISRVLSAAMIGFAMVPTAPAMAQSSVQFLPTPPDQGAPDGRQRGGATRGDCLAYQDLTAIIPSVAVDETTHVVWSQTTSATPTFFFDVPVALTEEIPLELAIQDANDEYAFYQRFTVNADAGLLAVPTVSETADQAGLSLDESYLWTFSIYCDESRPSASVSVSGTVQRVTGRTVGIASGEDLTPEEQFEQLQQYATAGIWHEAIEIAIALHQTNPNNVTYLDALESLLEQAGISNQADTAREEG